MGPRGRHDRRARVRQRRRGREPGRRRHRREALDVQTEAEARRLARRRHDRDRQRMRRPRQTARACSCRDRRSATTAQSGDATVDRGQCLRATTSSPGLCQQWEAATAPAEAAGVRVVHVRTGIVQAASGGTLARTTPAVQARPRRPPRLGQTVGQLDRARRRSAGDSLCHRHRRVARPGEPDRAQSRHQRGIHEGARQGRAPSRDRWWSRRSRSRRSWAASWSSRSSPASASYPLRCSTPASSSATPRSPPDSKLRSRPIEAPCYSAARPPKVGVTSGMADLQLHRPHERLRRAHVGHREGPAAAVHDRRHRRCSTRRPTARG